MSWLFTPENWIALLTLIALEIVLGIDNVIFISILCDRLPAHQRRRARNLGLGVAMIARIALLFSISWVMDLTRPLFSVLGKPLSGRDLVLVLGGLFLLVKSVREMHAQFDVEHESEHPADRPSLAGVIVEILLLDMVFSLDSVITAVGMVDQLAIMVIAVMCAVAIMMLFAGSVSGFVERYPTLKTLALSFLLLIGVTLVADGFGQHIPKGYIYFSMFFATGVEFLNLRQRKATRLLRRKARMATLPDRARTR